MAAVPQLVGEPVFEEKLVFLGKLKGFRFRADFAHLKLPG
jgi:hypothetical protein